MDDKLTEWEKEYLDIHLPEKVISNCYYDNPDMAHEDIEWLLEIVKKLRDQN
jgi:hypothetical protein